MKSVFSLPFSLYSLTFLLFMVGLASAQISGEQTGEWIRENSPYLVNGDITIPVGGSLVIRDSVEVRFQGPFAFHVKGVLNAQGRLLEDNETVNWVRFTYDFSPDSSELQNDTLLWRGIRFENSQSGSVLRYCIVEFAHARAMTADPANYDDGYGGGIYIYGCSPRLENSIIRRCKAELQGGGIYLWLSSSVVRNVLITRNESNLQGGGIWMDMTQIELHSLTLVQNRAGTGVNMGSGIFYGPDTSPFIRSSIIWHNGIISNNIYDDYRKAGEDVPADFLRFVIISQLSTSVDNYIFNEDPRFDTTSYDRREYRLQRSSRGVDGGAFQDDRWRQEAWEGHPSGGRINMGAWGGTPRATPSLPVAQEANSPITFYNIRPSVEYTFKLASIENIGHNTLTIHPDSVYFSYISEDEDEPQVNPNDTLRFMVSPSFRMPIEVSPDSTGEFEVGYQVDPAPLPESFINDTTYMKVKTDGGIVEFRLVGYPTNPIISFDPDTVVASLSISFDTLRIDERTTRTFRIYNIGDTQLQLVQDNDSKWMVMFTGNFEVDRPWLYRDSPWYNRRRDFIRIPPGDFREMTIHYPPLVEQPAEGLQNLFRIRPKDTGDIIDSVKVTSFDRNLYVHVNLYVYGGVLDAIRDDTLKYDFVDINPDSSRTLYVTLKNKGNRSLLVDNAVITDPDFTCDLPPEGIEIAQNDSTRIGITFNPDELIVYQDTILIRTTSDLINHVIDDSVAYYLQGRGTTGGIYFSGEIPNQFIPNVWGASNDLVYVCAGARRIPAGESLTIRKGVQVLFEGRDWIQIEGRLEALGTQDQRISFAPQNQTNSYYFGGLRFVACDPQTRLQWTDIRFACTDSVAADSETNHFYRILHHAHGGGIAVYNCNPSFYEVQVSDCKSHKDGGGMWIYQSRPSIIRCSFTNNLAKTNGGGVSLLGGEPYFHCNTIANNRALQSGGGMYFQYFANATITNSAFYNNLANRYGGALYVFDNSSPVFLNCVLYGDSATLGASSIYSYARSNPILRNSVVWGYSPASVHIRTAERAGIVARYSDIDNLDLLSDLSYDITVFNQDPLFDQNDLYAFVPIPGSPLLNGGDPRMQYEDASFPPSTLPARNDIGLYGGPFAAYWGGVPLKIIFFPNLASPRYLTVIVNTIPDSFSIAPTLFVQSWQDTTDYELAEISSGVYRKQLYIEESSYLVIRAEGTTVNNVEVQFRRSVSVAIYKPAAGGILTDPDGAHLILPPSSHPEMMLLAQPDLKASSPEEIPLSAPVGARWMVETTDENWSVEGEIILPYYKMMIPRGDELGLSIWCERDNLWRQMESSVDLQTSTVHARVDGPGTFAVFYTPGEVKSTLLPSASILGANYPNPFNPITTIPFDLSKSGRTVLKVFNVLGQEVATLADGWFIAGQHQVIWNSNDSGVISSGLYFYQLTTYPADGTEGIIQTRKLVLLR